MYEKTKEVKQIIKLNLKSKQPVFIARADNRISVWLPEQGILADVEAIGEKISLEDAKKEI